MRINVAQQLKGHVGESRIYSVNETSSEGLPVEGEAKLVLTNRSILVTGRFETTIKSTCSRCLEEFEQTFQFGLEEEYFPKGSISIEGHDEDDEDPDGFTISSDHILDLEEAFRQTILLNVPRKPVCDSECAGLCQRCGCNLNVTDCDCASRNSDQRWAPLERLLTHQGIEKLREVG